jgi:hypothetical protein
MTRGSGPALTPRPENSEALSGDCPLTGLVRARASSCGTLASSGEVAPNSTAHEGPAFALAAECTSTDNHPALVVGGPSCRSGRVVGLSEPRVKAGYGHQRHIRRSTLDDCQIRAYTPGKSEKRRNRTLPLDGPLGSRPKRFCLHFRLGACSSVARPRTPRDSGTEPILFVDHEPVEYAAGCRQDRFTWTRTGNCCGGVKGNTRNGRSTW